MTLKSSKQIPPPQKKKCPGQKKVFLLNFNFVKTRINGIKNFKKISPGQNFLSSSQFRQNKKKIGWNSSDQFEHFRVFSYQNLYLDSI